MRAIQLTLVAGLLIFIFGAPKADCSCYPESVEIEVTQHPEGGENVTALVCAFTATYTYEDIGQGMQFDAIWMNENGEHKSETFSIDSSNDHQSYSTSFAAPPGMFLDKTFWVEFRAENITGELKSDQAECTVP